MTEAGTNAPRRTVSRRRFILGGVSAALLLGAAGIAAVRTRGYPAPAGRALASLSAWQFHVVLHAARRICAPDRPEDPAIPSADDTGVAGFVDAWVARMAPSVRRDLGRFLAYVEHVAPLALGHASRFSRLGAAAQDRVLASLEASSSEPLRAGFDGLKSLVFMGYYRDPRTWPILGYDGPMIGRPEGGWR